MVNDTNRTDKRHGRNGEYGKMKGWFRKAANSKSRRDAKVALRRCR